MKKTWHGERSQYTMSLSINENISKQKKDVTCVEKIIYKKFENMEWNNVNKK